MKIGLLSLCHESMVLGEVTYCDYFGSGLDEQEELREALGPSSQVGHCTVVLTISQL